MSVVEARKMVLYLASIPLAVWKIPVWQIKSVPTTNINSTLPTSSLSFKERADLENSYRGTLVQAFGELFFIVTSSLTLKNIKVSEDKQVTERFSKSVEMLGAEKLEVRLGGIYMLERISKDSSVDYSTVMEVLTAFVREKSPRLLVHDESLINRVHDPLDNLEGCCRTDTQAALTVIERRNVTRDKKLDLTKTQLSGANLCGANLCGINFSSSILIDARFNDSVLNGVFLTDAILNGASLCDAKLKGAKLMCASLVMATLHRAELNGANLKDAHFQGAFLKDADLRNANLTLAKLNGADLVNTNFSGANLTYVEFGRADLTGAKLMGADLRGAVLGEVKLTENQIQKSIIDDATKLPKGFASTSGEG